MPSLISRLGVTHQCSLAKGSDSCLPKLPPQTNRIQKWIREFHKNLMVSSVNYNSRFFFRSRAAIFAERKRHLRSSHTFIIHPFSPLCIKREFIMCILWMFTFFKDPFTTAYFSNTIDELHEDLWRILDVVVDIIMLINIIFCFLTGIHKIQTKEVILEPSKIAKYYLLSYFFFDFFGTVPISYVSGMFLASNKDHDAFYTLLACLHFLRFVRIGTTLEYFRRITEAFSFEDNSYQLICLIILSLYFLHWWTCMIYIIPKLHYSLTRQELPNTSWVVMAQIQPSAKNVSVGRRYVECLLSAFCHFYRAGVGMYITEEPHEQIMFSLVIISGILFTSYLLVIVLQMVSSASASESKYEELVNQLGEYTRRKKLPQHIRRRLMLYYDNRFQKHYFKEQVILNTLSEHLRYEIFLQGCKGLVEKVSLFEGLSKSTVGLIVGCLKHEVFLPNDVITKPGTIAECMYFISHGTVAYIMPSGKEFCHLEDGDYFGEVDLFIPAAHESDVAQVIALEITEVFRLDKRDLEHCMTHDEEVGERLEKVANQRMIDMIALQREDQYDEGKQRRDVLYELRKGRILEHTHRRRKKY